MLTINKYAASLGVGLDVDWIKTGSGMETYFQAKERGLSFPQVLKNRGFSHARIRIKDYDIDTDKIVQVVDDCLVANLLPIVAFQGQHFKDDPTESTRQGVIEWWKRVALALKDHPKEVSFNLIIETTENVRNNPEALNLLYAECSCEVLAISPDRIMIIPPAGISSPSQLINLKVPNGCFAEAHFWAAGVTKTLTAPKVWTTGTAKEKTPFLKAVQDAKNWSASTGVPVYFGAVMVGNFTDNGDEPSTNEYSIEEQLELAAFISETLKSAGLPHAYNADQHYMDRLTGEWIPETQPVLDVVLS